MATPKKNLANKSETPAKKAAVKKTEPAKKPETAEQHPEADDSAYDVFDADKKEFARKPITVVKKTPKPPLKKPEVATAFENRSHDLAFSFAERMKQRAREDEKSTQTVEPDIKLSRRPTTRAKGKETLQFSQADLEEFRKRLIVLRQDALGQSANLKSIALEQTDDHGGEDDDGSDAFLRLQDLKQVDSRNKTIQKIDEALTRIADGSYGVCEICGQLIRKPRLLNLPFVHTCMECQTAMENPFGNR